VVVVVVVAVVVVVQTALQRHYANLQALALDRDTVEETPDYLLPDTEGMENVCPIALTPLGPRCWRLVAPPACAPECVACVVGADARVSEGGQQQQPTTTRPLP
jgi:hypothetical protein